MRQAAFRQLLNTYGRRQTPCFFLLNFRADEGAIWSLDQLSANEVLVQFPGFSNLPNSRRSHQRPIGWSVAPPSYADYLQRFGVVQSGLRAGDSYLVNLTLPAPLFSNVDARGLMLLSEAPYRIWWRDHFSCFSPETFMRIQENQISTYPMKGTAPDEAGAAERLLNDPKEQAEHATIVDLLRNDLARVSKRVRVVRYRYPHTTIQRKRGLLQTSSEISGQLPDNWFYELGDLLLELLPAGSVSGAPKPSTLQIIRSAEGQSRGYYCGIAGLFDGQQLETAVLIRFIEIQPNRQLRFWAGGGITANSDPQAEYQELLQKMHLPGHDTIDFHNAVKNVSWSA